MTDFRGARGGDRAARPPHGRGSTGTAHFEDNVHSGGSGPVAGDETQALVDAKIAAAEARTDSKLVGLTGRIDLLIAAVDGADKRQAERMAAFERQIVDLRNESKSDARSARGTSRNVGMGLAALIVGLVAVVVTMASLYPTAFSFGMQVRDIVKQEFQTLAPSVSVPTSEDKQ